VNTQTIKIPAHEARALQDILDGKGQDRQLKDGEHWGKYTAKFEDGYEADIVVVSGGHEPKSNYVDAVLFFEGNEVSVLGAGDTLLGTYNFEDYIEGEDLQPIPLPETDPRVPHVVILEIDEEALPTTVEDLKTWKCPKADGEEPCSFEAHTYIRVCTRIRVEEGEVEVISNDETDLADAIEKEPKELELLEDTGIECLTHGWES